MVQGSLHLDKALYRNAILRARKATLGEDDIVLLTGLANLGNEIHPAKPTIGLCARIATLFRAHPNFQGIGRVCIATAVHYSNQLMVLDAHVTDETGENLMVPGYRCFVAPDGSLFRQQAGEMRILPNVSRVIASFEEQDKPVQRSLGLVEKMGFRSGLCLPLDIQNRRGGFVFLNAREPFYFNMARNQDYLIYTNLAALARSAINNNAAQPNTSHVDLDSGIFRWEATRFDADALGDHLETIAAYRHRLQTRWRVERSGDRYPILISPSTIATFFTDLLVQLMLFRNAPELNLNVSVENETVTMTLTLDHLVETDVAAHLSVFLREPARYARANGWKLTVDHRTARVSFPADRASDREDILYSV